MRSWKHKTRFLRKEQDKNQMLNIMFDNNPTTSRMRKRIYIRNKNRDRRNKNTIDYYLREFEKSPYFEDCSYHPCVITKIYYNPEDNSRLDVDGTSLVTGLGTSCSCFHCGVQPLSKQEAEERRDYINEFGMLPYSLKYIYECKNENIGDLIAESMRMESAWEFAKNKKVEECTEMGKKLILEQYGIDISK
jgi:hypothetical protein